MESERSLPFLKQRCKERYYKLEESNKCKMSCGHHKCSVSNSAVVQSLDEMDFERGIWYAAQYGDVERIEKLIKTGCNVDKVDSTGYTALHYAARNGKMEVCKFLVELGADLNAVTKGGVSALCRAASTGKSDIVKYLLNHKADPFIQDSDGKTALHRAHENDHHDICKMLLEIAPFLKDIPDNKGLVVEE